jgi:hypothetical protein
MMDSARQVGAQERSRVADFVDRDSTSQRRCFLRVTQHLAKATDAGGGKRFHGAGRNGVDTNALRAEVCCKKTHAGLETRLGKPHHVVIGNDLGRGIVG